MGHIISGNSSVSSSQRTVFLSLSLCISGILFHPAPGETEGSPPLKTPHQKAALYASKISPREKFPFKSVASSLPGAFMSLVMASYVGCGERLL